MTVIESAAASGLTLILPDQRDIRRASTRGTGELILAALDWEPTRLLLCLGGTGPNDGVRAWRRRSESDRSRAVDSRSAPEVRRCRR
jgi:hypothetical protein